MQLRHAGCFFCNSRFMCLLGGGLSTAGERFFTSKRRRSCGSHHIDNCSHHIDNRMTHIETGNYIFFTQSQPVGLSKRYADVSKGRIIKAAEKKARIRLVGGSSTTFLCLIQKLKGAHIRERLTEINKPFLRSNM